MMLKLALLAAVVACAVKAEDPVACVQKRSSIAQHGLGAGSTEAMCKSLNETLECLKGCAGDESMINAMESQYRPAMKQMGCK